MSRRIKANEAAQYYGISTSNLRRWARDGKIEAEKTPGGRNLYIVPSKQTSTRRKIIYCRVSSIKQKGDLDRQIFYMRKKYPEYEVVSDIGSGINDKRKGFRSILESAFRGDVEQVVVAHGDRFSRFGFNLLQWIFSQFDASLITLERKGSDEQEMLNDVMEIFTVFSARYYGKRNYKVEDNKDSHIPECSSEEDI